MSGGSPFGGGAATSAAFGANTSAAQPHAANGIGPAAPMSSSGSAFGQTGFGSNLSAPTPNTGASLGGNMTSSGFAAAASNNSGGFGGMGGNTPNNMGMNQNFNMGGNFMQYRG